MRFVWTAAALRRCRCARAGCTNGRRHRHPLYRFIRALHPTDRADDQSPFVSQRHGVRRRAAQTGVPAADYANVTRAGLNRHAAGIPLGPFPPTCWCMRHDLYAAHRDGAPTRFEVRAGAVNQNWVLSRTFARADAGRTSKRHISGQSVSFNRQACDIARTPRSRALSTAVWAAAVSQTALQFTRPVDQKVVIQEPDYGRWIAVMQSRLRRCRRATDRLYGTAVKAGTTSVTLAIRPAVPEPFRSAYCSIGIH